jgi:hypothetical protein
LEKLNTCSICERCQNGLALMDQYVRAMNKSP